ncbi:MAG TPA: phosphate ABC transporter substrate-binding protein [Thermoanaerobaculaceae bacterium]|nr:phosphate ABC transporter substrate-binding protein [Thermoanaerobaculaceae bacterium]
MRRMRFYSLVCAVTTVAAAAGAQTVQVDQAVKGYERGAAVSGNLNSVGSDTMNNLMTYWGEAFAKMYPTVRIQVEGKGSSTAPPALIAGTSQFGPMSRAMTPAEVDAIEKKYGFQPTQIRTALDTIGVYVNKDNPLQSVSLPELDAVFSKTRKAGYPTDITTWGQLGLKGEWANKPISVFGRNSASGTYGFFKEHVLAKGDYKDTVKEQPGSASVVQGVSEDLYAIGYSGIGYRTSGVRPLNLAPKAGAQAVEPNYSNALSKAYPLSRYLFIYVVRDPRRAMDPLTKEFLKFVLSREGQEIVVKDGFLPLPAKVVAEELAKLQ